MARPSNVASKRKKPQASEIQRALDNKQPTFAALLDEVVFILANSLERESIKIHQIESRVKTPQSVMDKYAGGAFDTIEDITDVVGARVICLFKSDLRAVDKLINHEFNVISSDDKVEASKDTFGYMSVHYVCQMRKDYVGPRYEKIRGQKFEIQVRTLCMHAWAAISHYLDYKAEWDIPDELKKGLNALSGLFYVADVQYEQLYSSRQDAKKDVEGISSNEASGQSINFDTVSAMLRRLFPDRRPVDSDKISLFVRELTNNKYHTIGSVESDVVKSLDYLDLHDEDIKRQQNVQRTGPFFADLGAARVTLKKTNPNYEMVDFSKLLSDSK